MNQPDLFSPPSYKSPWVDVIEGNFTYPKKRENPKIRAEKWMEKNPHIYALYVKFAKELLSAGKSFSISLLTERIRWECHFHYDHGDFKISNDYRAYIARRLCIDLPELKDLLRFRPTKW